MPDELPLFVTEDNKKTLQEYLNLQRQLETVLVQQSKTFENIGYISKDLEERAKKRLQLQREHTVENTKDLAIINRELKRMSGVLTDTEREAARLSLLGAKNRMAARQQEFQLLGAIQQLEMETAKRRYDEEHKWATFASSAGKDLFGINVDAYNTAKKYGEQLEKYPFNLEKSAKFWGTILMLIKHAYDLFNKFDKAAAQFRIKMGMTRDSAAGLRKVAEDVAIEFMQVGVTIDGAYKSISALREQLGSAHLITKSMVKDIAVIAAQLGVSEENSTGFMRNLASISGTSMATQQNMMYTAAYMSQAAGVPLNQVMADVATKSEKTLTMMSRMPNVVLRTAIEARRLNTSIDSMARGSRSLLDFNESVNAEMDASVLLGRSINLQRARELAYRRDIEGSTKEILRITKSINFENLDVFQQEAFARATGRSVDELLKMVQADREWNKAKKSSDPQVRAMVENYEKMRKASEKTIVNETEKLKLIVQQKANQDRLTSISNKWNAILSKTTYFLFPVIDATLSIIENLMEAALVALAIGKQFKMIGTALAGVGLKVWEIGRGVAKIGKVIQGWGVSLKSSLIWKLGGWVKNIGSAIAKWQHSMAAAFSGAKVGGFFGKVFGFFGKIWSVLAKVGGFFGKMFKFLTPIGSMFGKFAGLLGFVFKWVPVIGWVITAIQFVVNLFKRLNGIGEAFKGGILNGILFGLKAIGLAIYDTLLKPFVDAWNWIKSIFVGNSPSNLALGIVNGIASVGAMLFDAITAPWRKALAWIFDKIPGMGKVAEKLKGGLSEIVGDKNVEKKASAAYVPAVTVAPDGTKVATPAQQAQQGTQNLANTAASNDKTLADILDAINKLNANLESGKIGFYVDGQLLSATIARQSEFRGGYGVNKVS